MHTASYDIIIVGGGMVGLTLALALAQQTALSICILEAQAQASSWAADTYHHRVSAFALSSQKIFKALQVWDLIKAKRVSPFNKIFVWDEATKAEINFDCHAINESILGFIIENNAVQSTLEEKIKHYPHIKYVSGVQLQEFVQHEKGIELITNTDTFKAKLVVAADGANSWLRTKANILLDKIDYEQAAIVATVATELPHQRCAQQVFLPIGPLAFLPLAESNLSSIVWSLPTEEAKKLCALDEETFKQELAQAFSQRLGSIQKLETRYTFPLRKQQAKRYIQSRLALVGDAAHTIHPLAGQGVNMGLLDAASLAEVIVEAHKKGRDFASETTLRRYERWRHADNFSLLKGVDVIKSLFASDKKSIQHLRACGLNLTNQISLIKNIFMHHAVGVRGGLPSLIVSPVV